MTKLQKNRSLGNRKKYKAINILLYILTAISVIGAFQLNSFTRRKLGVLRHIVYLNGVWEKTVPILALKNIAIILLIASIVFVFRLITRDKQLGRIHNIIYIAVSVFTLTFIFTQSKDTIKPYYMVGTLLIIASVFQFINVLIIKKSNEKIMM